jgi:hypothetical protein
MHLKNSAQKFEQPITYQLVWWIIYKTHLTHSKTLLKQEGQWVVFVGIH